MPSFLWEGIDEGAGTHLVNWEFVPKPLDLGGLGIGNLRLHNETWLAIWLWRFLPGVRFRVIVSKYGSYPFELASGRGSKDTSRNVWIGIYSGFLFFLVRSWFGGGLK